MLICAETQRIDTLRLNLFYREGRMERKGFLYYLYY